MQRWTEQEKQYVTKHYKRKTDAEIARKLGKTAKAVQGYRNTHGLKKDKSRGRRWTDKDLAYLKKNWGCRTAPSIARSLKRTTVAVQLMAHQVGLFDQMGQGNMLSLQGVARVMGIKSPETVLLWVNKYGLKARRERWGPARKNIVQSQTHYIILWEDLLEWLEGHQELWDSRGVKHFGLGVEYPWLTEKRAEDRKKFERYKTWTTSELRQLEIWAENDVPYKVIAERLNRSVSSVKNRVIRMKRDKEAREGGGGYDVQGGISTAD